MQQQIFESYLFLEEATKKAKKEGKEFELKFVRYGPLEVCKVKKKSKDKK